MLICIDCLGISIFDEHQRCVRLPTASEQHELDSDPRIALILDAVTSGTNSNAQQTSTITNEVAFPSGGPTTVTYDGAYTVRSAPAVYAPSLTASVTETCWGSVSGGVSVVGVGATAAATIKDDSCNRRLDAAVAWRRTVTTLRF